MLVDREELCGLIPHAGSMCLLDEVTQWDEQSITCVSRSHLLADNPLRKNHQLSAVHAVEYGAQAMAVHGGLLASQQGTPIKPGYLAALRNVVLHVSRLDDLQAPLTVGAQQVMADRNNLMYTFDIHTGDVPVASARATVITQT